MISEKEILNQEYEIYELLIIEEYLDTLGHVNNATYLQILEQARWDFMTRGGYGLKEVQTLEQSPVVLEVNLKFRREISNREKVKVYTFNKDTSKKIMTIDQAIVNTKGEIATYAHFTIGFMDLKQRRLIPPSDLFLKALLGQNRG